ncbi:MAG TPA: CHAT domain-containing protein [Kofleriaceae bacterium]|nr:CHAT domain-containing protein [Kofleriaceae bacterium]
MRLLGTALVVAVWLCSVAEAKPKQTAAPKPTPAATAPGKPAKPGKQATPQQQAEIAKLEQELTQHQIKQAYFAALKVAKQLWDLQKKATGEDSPEAQRRKAAVASAMSNAGDYAGAQKLYEEILHTTEKEKGPESREALYALMPLTSTYWSQSRFGEVEPLMKRQLELTKKVEGEKSPMYSGQLQMYAGFLTLRNEFSAAQRVYEQVLQLAESTATSKTDISLLGPVQALANSFWQTNQQQKAIQLFERAITIVDAQTVNGPIMKMSTRWGIAAQYSYGGRKDLGLPLMKKAIEIGEKDIAQLEKDKPDDYQIPAMLGQIGYMYRQIGDLPHAEKAYLKTIALAEKKKTYSGYEASLADLRREQGKPKEALALLEKGRDQMAKLSPISATVYNTQIAQVLSELGEYKRAMQLLDEHRKFVIKQYGKKHPMYITAQMSAVNVYAAAGEIKEAESILDDALDAAERDLANVMRSGTDADHAIYFARNSYILDTALNFGFNYAPNSGSAARLALTTLLRRKGRILDAAAASLATIRSKLSPDDKKILDELNSARAQLAKLVNAGPGATGGDADAYGKEVAALEEKVLKLEIAVSKKSAAYRTVTQPIELAAIQKVIPSDARLIEIVNYQPWDPRMAYTISPKLQPRHYAAYVLGAKGDPAVIELGEAAAIDKAIEDFRKAVADPDNDRAGDLGNALFKLTMGKIVPKLGGATNILVAPDGALNVVPFSALVDDNKQFLIKKYTFTYLTSGRDLLRVGLKTKAQGGGVVFADPKFDSTGPAAPGGGTTRGARSVDLRSLRWVPLPGTGQEADALIKAMKNLKVYRGDQATEGALKGLHAPKILHLATHGFFLPDEAPPPAPDQSQGGPPMGLAMPGSAVNTSVGSTYENPLLRSGLALAGANKLQSGDDDGVLTALEASGLDLWGTKLVVLSACETGVGKVSNGDGVYGLRRSLVIAGAESLVMTLWQVDDFATKDLMAGFYKKLAAGKPRSAALREMQLEIAGQEKYAHPFYWASFLPAGALTPIKD